MSFYFYYLQISNLSYYHFDTHVSVFYTALCWWAAG